jgi:uncharacterized circularly permuted ATP-grasp superfamily protein
MDNQNPVPTAPTLSYDPYATVVYNASTSYYSEAIPETITAEKVTSVVRNERIRGEQVVKLNGMIDKTRDYLIENYDELGDHADEIAKLLGIELSSTIEVEFDVTIRATITVPVGQSAYDLSTYDFDVELSSNERDYDVEDYTADINSISER